MARLLVLEGEATDFTHNMCIGSCVGLL